MSPSPAPTETRPGEIFAGTGHRPEKIRLQGRNGYHPLVFRRLVELAKAALARYRPERVISGMAQGWDQALAVAATEVGIPFDAYIPFIGQEERWPEESQAFYHTLLAKAERIHVTAELSPEERKDSRRVARAMNDRNRAMIRDSTTMLALYNGTPGGTGNTIRFCKEKGRKVIHLWNAWLRHAASAPPTPSAKS